MDLCPLCYSDASIQNASYPGHKRVTCPVCGEYYFQNFLFNDSKNTICAYIFNATKKTKTIPVFSGDRNFALADGGEIELVTPEQLSELYPKNLTDLIDQIILNLAFYLKTIGNKINNVYLNSVIDRQYAKKSAMLKTIFCVIDNNIDQINVLLTHLEKLGYIEPLAVGVFSLTLSFKGWMRVERLLNKSESPNQALLLVSRKDSVAVCRETMKKVATELNLTPKFTDEKQFTKPVITDIFYEIRQSKIVIADLTYQRPYIYYETGYAEALKKPVIYTCKQGYSVNRQLNTIHNNLIKWETPEQLYEALFNRAKAALNLQG
ncbi:MAG TPA: hypothetical protein VIL24_06510 [Clostridia bacterium]